MIAIIDYKMGNILSVAKAFERAGAEVRLTASLRQLERAKALILPGVGAFAAGMNHLRKRKLIKPLQRMTQQDKPLLGICLGMQLLCSGSEEHGVHKGLDLIPGQVVRFSPGLKVPHMGWNTVSFPKTAAAGAQQLVAGVRDKSYFYFVHSYYVQPDKRSVVAGRTDYGRQFTSMVCRGNVFGVQFHPEKSAEAGMQIVRNFCRLVGEV